VHKITFVNSRESEHLIPFLEKGVRKSGDGCRFCMRFSRVFSKGDPVLNAVDALGDTHVVRPMVSVITVVAGLQGLENSNDAFGVGRCVGR